MSDHTMVEGQSEIVLDLSGLLCPLPVLKARKRLEIMTFGQVLKIIATDPVSVIDMPHFCNEQGHTLLDQVSDANTFIFWIKRK